MKKNLSIIHEVHLYIGLLIINPLMMHPILQLPGLFRRLHEKQMLAELSLYLYLIEKVLSFQKIAPIYEKQISSINCLISNSVRQQ